MGIIHDSIHVNCKKSVYVRAMLNVNRKYEAEVPKSGCPKLNGGANAIVLPPDHVNAAFRQRHFGQPVKW